MIANILFAVLLGLTAWLAGTRLLRVRKSILSGRDVLINDNSGLRWKTMIMVALGQSKMMVRPIPGILHFLVYAGFLIVNIELLEIVIDGLFGTHRILRFMGGFYVFLIHTFEYFALAVIVACIIFLIRRNVLRIKRFHLREMTSWPKSDANIILIVEILLMTAFLTMNAADSVMIMQNSTQLGLEDNGLWQLPVSRWFQDLLPDTYGQLHMIERVCWWFHIIGIFGFLVYLPHSKHLHIILSFPNVYYGSITPKGKFKNNPVVTREVNLMINPDAGAFAAPATDSTPEKFGAKDTRDLTWKQLLDAYSCTECGRCTSVCPANQTGKLLSPRKIMMDTRDRAEELSGLEMKGLAMEDGKSLLGSYITEEEVWACTTCNACTDACPVNINPLGIIMDLRQFLIMEESKSPESITGMFNNIENNGAPWAFPAAERLSWKNDL